MVAEGPSINQDEIAGELGIKTRGIVLKIWYMERDSNIGMWNKKELLYIL